VKNKYRPNLDTRPRRKAHKARQRRKEGDWMDKMELAMWRRGLILPFQ